MESKRQTAIPMENVHLLNRYRIEMGWTIERVAHVIGSSKSKTEKNVLKLGKLSVGELELLSRAWNIPITKFFSKDLLPDGMEQDNISTIKNEFSNENGDNNFLNEGKANYGYQDVDNLLIERKKTINLLEKQLEKQREDIEFLKKLVESLR